MSRERPSLIARLSAGPMRGVAVEVLVNLIAPYLIYEALRGALGDVKALLASSLPPVVWSLIGLIRARRLDVISAFALASIGLSLLAYVGGGGVKVLQLRERLITALIGLAFLVSALIDRPVIAYLARAGLARSQPQNLEAFDARSSSPGFKRTMRRITLVWGAGLLIDAGVSTWLVFRLTIAQYLVAGPVLGYAVIGALTLWTFLSVRGRQRRARTSPPPAPVVNEPKVSGTPDH